MYDIKLIAFPNPILKAVAEPVLESELESMKNVSSKMIEIMDEGNGIGLAGPQVNILKRIIVVKCDGQNITLLNPEITQKSGLDSVEEGCLSLKGIRIRIKRSSSITVKYLSLNGEEKILEAHGILAICIEHEIDHLQGILIVDRAGPMKDLFLKKYFKGRK